MGDGAFVVDVNGAAWPRDSAYGELVNRFTHHPPTPEQAAVYPVIRGAALRMAELLMVSCPMCRESAIALTRLDEVVFWANAAIARRGVAPLELAP